MPLVLTMSLEGPGMDHVQQAYPFKAEELSVTCVGEFVAKDRVDSAKFIDEDWPVANRGKDKVLIITIGLFTYGALNSLWAQLNYTKSNTSRTCCPLNKLSPLDC